MSLPILQTKIHAPPVRANLVARPRLMAALAQALLSPATFVIAPSGFGKTTLLGEWRSSPEGKDRSLAWLTLDASDGEPSRFWTYVVAALRTIPSFSTIEDFGKATLAALGNNPNPEIEKFLTSLINDIAESTSSFVLVLDDYHLVAGPKIDEALGILLNKLPACMRIVLLTRVQPEMPLGKLRANGGLTEIRADDLRFTLDEASAFLDTVSPDLSKADITTLHDKTEGWPAGLQMIALSLRRSEDRRAAVASFAGDHRHVADYFAEEILAKIPGQVLEFLSMTSILDRLCAPLCDAVTKIPDSQTMLERIERANLFLTPLDDERRWYRYHRLLADMLRARLERTNPGVVVTLHRRASIWFEQENLAIEAVIHSLAAKDYGRVAEISDRYGNAWWSGTPRAFLDMRLPPEVTSLRPSFCISEGWGYTVRGQLEQAKELFDSAERLIMTGGQRYSDAPGMLGFVSVLRTYIAELEGRPYTITEDVFGAPHLIPEEATGVRNTVDLTLAYAVQMEGGLDKAASLLQTAIERDIRFDGMSTVALGASRLARIRLIQGRLWEAESVLRKYLDVMQSQGVRRYYINGNLNAVLADILRERGRLDEAAEQAEEALAFNEYWGLPHGIALALHAKARVLAARGDVDGAIAALYREEQLSFGRTIMSDLVSERRMMRVIFSIVKGELTAAELRLSEGGITIEDRLSFRRETDHITLARLLIATNRRDKALHLLGRLAVAAKTAGRNGRLIEILILQAIAQERDNIRDAVRTLEQAIILAEPENYVRIFTGEGQPVPKLLRLLAAGKGPMSRYAGWLVSTMTDSCEDVPSAPYRVANAAYSQTGHSFTTQPAVTPANLAEPLTARETEILELMAGGMSNSDIGGKLYLTIGTVKTHVHNILAKLEVESRTQAIARAREMGLL